MAEREKALSSPLKIYCPRERRKRVFQPLKPQKAAMYVCGPTVYDLLHIGNFRGAVFYNFVRNYLRFLGFEVKYVYNFTDVDDKILARARAKGMAPQKLSAFYIKEFQKDYSALKLAAPDLMPKATETLEEMQALIQSLLKKGLAYEAAGDVFFSVKAFKGYGSLSGQNLEELRGGERELSGGEGKKDPLDFALWKRARPEEGWSFESPWGPGRPGWHIECSAMIRKHLGEEIDIHGGGIDLIFPHHENESAQSEGSSGKRLSRFWLRHGMLKLSGEKMSKSLGNLISMRDFLKNWPAEVFKFLIFSSHYRSESHFSDKAAGAALTSLMRIYSRLKLLRELSSGEGGPEAEREFEKALQKRREEMLQALNDDFSTPRALALFFAAIKDFEAYRKTAPGAEKTSAAAKALLRLFQSFGALFVLFQEEPGAFLQGLEDRFLQEKGLQRQDIERLLQKRARLRRERRFQEADKIRARLAAQGIEAQDSAKGTSWTAL